MIVLLDANILLRLAHPSSPSHITAANAISALRSQGHLLRIVLQTIYEFWVVATRPTTNNGLGLSVAECTNELVKLKASFPILNDMPTLFAEWEAIVSTFSCHGKVAHDARYVAAMRTLGVSHLLTFNVGDFARYSTLTILDPNVVAASPPSSITP